MKVAVYTIALNEAAHAERWANSAADADYRIVADTGSTDGTVDKLRASGVTVHQIAVKPWRFDDARNAALALIPADADVCCTMDMDRILEPGWRGALEAAWRPETTALFHQVHYRPAFDDPTILRSFSVKNFHRRSGYRFKRPVHEALYFTGEEVVQACPQIVMCEVQDFAKDTRRQYTPLMELAHREDPGDAQICFWLGREYMHANRPDEAAVMFERYLAAGSTWGEERSEAMRYLARVQPDRKMHWLDRARAEAAHRREIWLDLAEGAYAEEDWSSLFWACTNGIGNTRRTGSYLDDAACWGPRLFALGAVAAWHLGALERAVDWETQAAALDSGNEQLKNNLAYLAARVGPPKHASVAPQEPAEAWQTQLSAAQCLRDLKDEEGFVAAAHKAFEIDPSRPEPLQYLADHLLSKGRGDEAAVYADAAMATLGFDGGRTADDLGVLHGFSVAANWTGDPERKRRGRQICDWLALDRATPANVRMTARWNSGWYAEPLEFSAPSVHYHAVTIQAPEGYNAANISIFDFNNEYSLLVRAANYTLIDGWHVKGDDPSYRSRMLFCALDEHFNVSRTVEVHLPSDLPVRSTEALGFDDPRGVVWRGDLWCVASSRQLNAENLAEMVLARIDFSSPDHPRLTDWRALPSGMPPRWEKNWMPQVVGDDLRFLYSVDPTRVLAADCSEIANRPSPVAADTFFGGSQLVPFDDGWLAVIHESEWVNRKRRYFHRFVWFDVELRLQRLSRRFYFLESGYEFAAGLAWHRDGQRLLVSFSRNDRDPTLAFLSASDIRAMTISVEEHRGASATAIKASAHAQRMLLQSAAAAQENVTGRALAALQPAGPT